MRKLRIALLLLYIFPASFLQAFPAHSNTSQPYLEETRLRGLVKNPTRDLVEVRLLKNLISLEEQLFSVPLNEDHSFDFSFSLDRVTTVTLIYDDLEFSLYLEPGNDLRLEFDALNIWDSMNFVGSGALHNQFLFEQEKRFQQWNTRGMVYEIAQRQAMDFRSFMDRLRRHKLSHLKEFPGYRSFSAAFRKFAEIDIDYWWAYQLLRYRVEHAVANSLPNPLELPNGYYSFFNQVLINNEEALNNRHYLLFLDRYLALRNEQPDELAMDSIFLESFLVSSRSMLILSSPDQPPILGGGV